MRTKEAIYKITSNPFFTELDNLLKMSKEDFDVKYENKKVKLYNDYYKSLFHYRVDNIIKQLPNFSNKLKIKLGLFTIIAYITIEIESLSRKEAKMNYKLSFHSDDTNMFWGKRFELPLNLNLNNPKPQIKKILQKHIVPEGYFNIIQFNKQCNIKDAISWYKILKENYKDYDTVYGNKTFYKWVKRNFNIKTELSIDKVVDFINKKGKQKELINLIRTSLPSMSDFDGDCNELETYFWDHMEQFPINTIMI